MSFLPVDEAGGRTYRVDAGANPAPARSSDPLSSDRRSRQARAPRSNVLAGADRVTPPHGRVPAGARWVGAR